MPEIKTDVWDVVSSSSVWYYNVQHKWSVLPYDTPTTSQWFKLQFSSTTNPDTMPVQQEHTNIQHWSLIIQDTAQQAEFTRHNKEHSYTIYDFLPPFQLHFHPHISCTVKLIPPVNNWHNCELSYTIERLLHCHLVQLSRCFVCCKKTCLTLETGQGEA